MTTIKTWHERTFDKWDKPMSVYMREEITDLRTALLEREQEEIQRLTRIELKLDALLSDYKNLRTAAQQALEALKFAYNNCTNDWTMDEKIDPAIASLTAALKGTT